jgi:hypothetical protein
MISFSILVLLGLFLVGLFRINFLIFWLFTSTIAVTYYFLDYFSAIELGVLLIVIGIIVLIFCIKQVRRTLITKAIYEFLKSSTNNWSSFQRIDDGWFSSEFEKSIFQGNPIFIKTTKASDNNCGKHNKQIIDFLQSDTSTNTSLINKISKIKLLSLYEDESAKNLTPQEISQCLKSISKINPVLSSIIGLLNLDSFTSMVYHFGNKDQKSKFLPDFKQGKLLPFLKTTQLYESLESKNSPIEGRIEKSTLLKNKSTKTVFGISVSFQDLILLGTSKSNCFYINVNIKDFNNLIGNKTNIGTAICLIDPSIKGLIYKKGLPAYEQYLKYYACTGTNIFIPFTNILNNQNGLGKGLEYLYRNQCFASNIWPLATAIPTHNTATLTAWYFAHLQKQNGRQLISYKIVISKLNEQFSQCLKLQVNDHLAISNNIKPELLKFTSLLNKNLNITNTMKQLSLLRDILGSNSHNIKTESKLRSFYKVSHLSTELDGMSHEINQLPLIKKAALSCHPYYEKEVNTLLNPSPNSINEFDNLIFKHMKYILQNLCRVWYFSLNTSFIFRMFLSKNKYKYMIRRMSASFALLSDITLIRWTFKSKVNTSFASFIGSAIQHLTMSIATLDYYQNNLLKPHEKSLAKYTLKNLLFSTQLAIKETINLAYSKFGTIMLKLIFFPFGRPFHNNKLYTPLDKNLDQICKDSNHTSDTFNSYSPFLEKIYRTTLLLKQSETAETAVTNATGTSLTTDNYELLINRCLAAGILSIEQSENLRTAYKNILEIQLTNHFGSHYEK